jgi:hypothetical protein
MKARNISFVVLCPHCKNPFHYIECRFDGGENDSGGWQVDCKECKQLFKVQLQNPRESTTEHRWQVVKEIYDWPGEDDLPIADNRVKHNLLRKKTALTFKTDVAPLFRCAKNGQPLDTKAYQMLETEKSSLQNEWIHMENFLLSSCGPSSDKIMVCIGIECTCGVPHLAVFYAPTYLGANDVTLFRRCLLAHVSNASLEDRLNCLASKSDIMDLLEKLLIRWHYISDQILLATPFIGHQWMKPNEVQEIWDWLFQNLDPAKVTLLTRKATWTSFKNIQKRSGFSFEDLERYGLEDKVVSAGGIKQDSHAKFFAGVSKDGVEILSGSANLLRGPSIENISFHKMTAERFNARYLNILKYVPPPPLKAKKLGDTLLFENGSWKCTTYITLEEQLGCKLWNS